MCKYCDLTTIREHEFRNERNLDPIVCVKDGSRITDVLFNRYIVTNEKIRRAELILESGVIIEGGFNLVKSKSIKIKYCPFCGEKL